jgi:hypothetical protein
MNQIVVHTTRGLVAFDAPSSSGQDVSFSTPVANVTLTREDASVQVMSPAAPFNVVMPVAVDAPGKAFQIVNLGSGDLSVLQAASDGGVTLTVLCPGFSMLFVGTGDAAINSGWSIWGQRVVGDASVATMTGNLTLDGNSARTQILDPDAANRNVGLPASTDVPGEVFRVVNAGDGEQTLSIFEAASEGGAALAVIRPGEVFEAISLCDGVATWSRDLGPLARVGIQTLPIAGAATETLIESSGAWILTSNTGPNAAGPAVLRMPPEGECVGRLEVNRFDSLGGAAGTETLSVLNDAGGAIGAGIVLPDAAGVVTRSSLLLACDGVDWLSLGAYPVVAASF